VVIGFATSAGDTADDGNEGMSPYAKALSVRLKEPNKDITKVLGLVALDVSKKRDQNPILRTNLAFDVLLNEAKSSKIVIIDGLMYQNQPFNRMYTWQRAKDYCKDLILGGYTNWRLPTKDELKKLSTKNKNKNGYSYYVRKEFVNNMLPYKEEKKDLSKNFYLSNIFWTSSLKKGTMMNPITKERFKNNVFTMSFEVGLSVVASKEGTEQVLCVH